MPVPLPVLPSASSSSSSPSERDPPPPAGLRCVVVFEQGRLPFGGGGKGGAGGGAGAGGVQVARDIGRMAVAVLEADGQVVVAVSTFSERVSKRLLKASYTSS